MVTGLYANVLYYLLKAITTSSTQAAYNLPSGCYRCRGIPSFPREQELMKNQRIERLSAYDP